MGDGMTDRNARRDEEDEREACRRQKVDAVLELTKKIHMLDQHITETERGLATKKAELRRLRNELEKTIGA